MGLPATEARRVPAATRGLPWVAPANGTFLLPLHYPSPGTSRAPVRPTSLMNVSDVRRFDGFEFNLRTGELRRLGLPVVLERQPARALAALVVNAGRLVTRDELRQAIWPADARADFDRGLTDCLRQIRLAL